MDVEKLARMANQIATNFDYGSDKDKVVAGIVDHLSRFWSPSMRAELIEAYRGKGVELSELAARAVAQLPPPKTTAA
jgi:formate dehydrogenase subunit delta